MHLAHTLFFLGRWRRACDQRRLVSFIKNPVCARCICSKKYVFFFGADGAGPAISVGWPQDNGAPAAEAFTIDTSQVCVCVRVCGERETKTETETDVCGETETETDRKCMIYVRCICVYAYESICVMYMYIYIIYFLCMCVYVFIHAAGPLCACVGVWSNRL